MDINYELYKVFYHVATTLSFSEASRYLVSNIISQAISQLPLDYPVLAPEEKQRIIQELKF